MKKIACILSGCGHLDGSEIREAIISLLEIDKAGAIVECFAPNINQLHVINHLSSEEVSDNRSVLEESARITRGKIKDLEELATNNFDALLIPGGYGVAKNLSNFALKGVDFSVNKILSNIIIEFFNSKKPIGAMCISPIVVVKALKEKADSKIKVTIGSDNDNLIEQIGGINIKCNANECTIDELNNIISCPAYMQEDSFSNIAEGISKAIQLLVKKA